MNAKNQYSPFVFVVCTLLLHSFGHVAVTNASSDDYNNKDYEYDYGDRNYDYHDNNVIQAQPHTSKPAGGVVSPVVGKGVGQPDSLPLCCPQGSIYDYNRCGIGGQWRPELRAAPTAEYLYTEGFPRCFGGGQPVDIHGSDVFIQSGALYLPTHVQLAPVHDYCVTRITEAEIASGVGSTKVFVCLEDPGTHVPVFGWVLLAVGQLLLVTALVAYCTVPSLRNMQGHYMICLLVSLFLYNLCLYPGSVVSMPDSQVSCVALKAVKYFFFCSVFLWFAVICFDVYRIIRRGSDLSSGTKRRFIYYSLFTWVTSAALTTATLVLVIVTSNDTNGDQSSVCNMNLAVHVILQLCQGLSLVAVIVLLSLCCKVLCNYRATPHLSKHAATKSVVQCFKLFAVMFCHSLINNSHQIVPDTVIRVWQYVVLECVAVFAILVYTREVKSYVWPRVKQLCRCSRTSGSDEEDQQPQQANNLPETARQIQYSATEEKIRLSSC